jgi:2-oxoisovalerate dehydrogenase E1 component
MLLESQMDEHEAVKLELLADLRLAHLSRAIDDREIILAKQGRMLFQLSGAGHEAFLIGLARSFKPGTDWFFPYYRDRALMLALGMTPEEMLLHSVGAAEDPSSGGRQLPSHWGSKRLNIPPSSSPTGSQSLPAVGCAEAGRYIAKHPRLDLTASHDEITVCSLGDGSTSEGEFWEGLAAACTMRLPVLFIIADNGYSHSVRTDECVPGPISSLVRGFPGLRIADVDGTDYFEVRETGADIISSVRAGLGPALIRGRVTRPYSHSSVDTQKRYRLVLDLEEEERRDPITRLENRLIEQGITTREECDEIRAEAVEKASAAAEIALAAPKPDPKTVMQHIVDIPSVTEREASRSGPGEPMNLLTATNQILAEILENDETTRMFGEDIADAPEDVVALVEGKGGIFGVTHDLQRNFGFDRCYNTPIAEASIAGRAIGQAYRGLHPLPEIQFVDFVWPAMQQLRSEAATVRWRSNGSFNCPMVLRLPSGGYLGGGAAIWHSQSGESTFAHIPGLLIAYPSTVADTVGLMRTAMQAQDPVLFFEHKHLLRQSYLKAPYPADDYMVPFGKARVVREGTDMTIVTYGATVHFAERAIEQLTADEGRSIELIDLRTIAPWDRETVGNSVAKTSRVLIVHEDTMTGGFGAEVAAWISDEMFSSLDAPVVRVAAKDAHVAYDPECERTVLPQPEDILAGMKKVLAY